MIPLKDENPTRGTAFVTITLIAACVVVFFWVQPGGRSLFGSPVESDTSDLRFTVENAAIPCEVLEGRPLTADELNRTFAAGDSTACDESPAGSPAFPQKNVFVAVLVSMFLHGGLLHLGGNMLYLWIFGNNIEDTWGHVPYALFYVASGLAAMIAHIAVQPDSTVPVVGASGAIAGVMGAYLVLFPRAPIKTLLVLGFFVLFRDVRAWLLLAFWFTLQFFTGSESGVAWMAHVGGFVFGVVVALAYRAIHGPVERRRSYAPTPLGY